MATTKIEKLETTGKVRIVLGSLTFDNSYPTGGESIDFGLKVVYVALFEPVSGYVFEYDKTNKKVIAYYADYDAVADGALIQVPNLSAILDTKVARCIAVGE